MEQGPLGLNPELRTPPLPATHVRAGTGHRVLARNYTTDQGRPSYLRVHSQRATSCRNLWCAFTPPTAFSVSVCATRSVRPAAPAPSSEPNPHTTPSWDRRTSQRWPGNCEKLASSGCPSVRMKTTFAKPYSPRSEGHSRAPTRSRVLLQRWIQAQCST
jgi:hypothetical protein